MEQSSISFYERLGRWRWPRSYRGKFFLVAFLGTHAPLIAAVAYALAVTNTFSETWPLLEVLLAATLIGSGATLAALHHLLRPLPRTAQALGATPRTARCRICPPATTTLPDA